MALRLQFDLTGRSLHLPSNQVINELPKARDFEVQVQPPRIDIPHIPGVVRGTVSSHASAYGVLRRHSQERILHRGIGFECLFARRHG
jgi:hypothetical protein